MNVYTLYEVRDTLIEGEQKKQIALLDEIALNVRRTIYRPYRGFNTLELEPIKGSLEQNGQFPEQIREKLVQVAESPVFNGVYYTQQILIHVLREAEYMNWTEVLPC